MWPVHMPASHRKAAWKNGILSDQFPDMMEHYYGPNVAFYFAWLKHYTIWLVMPGNNSNLDENDILQIKCATLSSVVNSSIYSNSRVGGVVVPLPEP